MTSDCVKVSAGLEILESSRLFSTSTHFNMISAPKSLNPGESLEHSMCSIRDFSSFLYIFSWQSKGINIKTSLFIRRFCYIAILVRCPSSERCCSARQLKPSHSSGRSSLREIS